MRKLLLVLLFISGCKYNLEDTDYTLQNKIEKKLYKIELSPEIQSTYSPTQYITIGKYDDGSLMDISSQVEWEVTMPDTVKFNKLGTAFPLSIGSTKITASLNGIISNEVSLNIIEPMICGHFLGQEVNSSYGGGINDSTPYNASSNCLKIREVNLGEGNRLWFTSSPSINFVKNLNYHQNSSKDNKGDSYHAISHTIFGSFVTFSQSGDGENGQLGRWCEKLAMIAFAGRNDWRIPNITELIKLYNYENVSLQSSMNTRFG